MIWNTPPLNKVYEALGAIGDQRIEVNGNTAKVYSSSRNKYYDVIFNPSANSIYSNDNGSYFVGYLGYPSIAFLLVSDVISYSPKLAQYLAGFAWKDLNQKFKNDFGKTDEYIDRVLVKKYNLNISEFHDQLNQILKAVTELELEQPKFKTRPPQGY